MTFHFNPNIDSTLAFFPRRYATLAVAYYFVALGLCTVLYMSNALPLYIALMGAVSILLFFFGANSLGKQWAGYRERKFIKKVFVTALLLRLAHIVIVYMLNKWQYDTYYESSAGDITYYMPTALQAAQTYQGNLFQMIAEWHIWSNSISDFGYIFYLFIVMTLAGAGLSDSVTASVDNFDEYYIILPLLIKAIWGAWTCVLMYKIARRHFGENVGRMTAIFCVLQWNMIWWCGSCMKETEMVLLAVLFAERMDRIVLGINIKPWFIVGTVLLGLALFSFRSALFMTSFAATILALVMARSRTLTTGKKVLAGFMIALALGAAVGDNIVAEAREIVERAQSDHQKTNMEWRATHRENANKFAKYAGASVFAPLIFTIPFPNMVYTHQGQEMLMQVNGGNFEKNVLSFFVIFAMLQLLLSGAWRQHVFPIVFLLGYLAALVLSEFAQSGRFHMPIMPFLMMFAAYGLTMVTSRKHKQWFTYALIAEVGFCVFWSWFKLKGQGLI